MSRETFISCIQRQITGHRQKPSNPQGANVLSDPHNNGSDRRSRRCQQRWRRISPVENGQPHPACLPLLENSRRRFSSTNRSVSTRFLRGNHHRNRDTLGCSTESAPASRDCREEDSHRAGSQKNSPRARASPSLVFSAARFHGRQTKPSPHLKEF
jgi:hypothetical protein